MKKVAFMFVAAMAISFASCGGQTKAVEEACDSAENAVVEAVEVIDSLACDSVAEVVEGVVAE